MPVIKPSCIRDLKLRINLVDVVGGMATLKRAGSRFLGLCPFHREKTPSFHVDPDRGYYKCFGCGKSGDIFTFLQETEQLNFTEAVETLGQRFGVPIEYEQGAGPTKEERSLRQELFDLHEVATDYFHQVLRGPSPLGSAMRSYWTQNRGFDSEIANDFKIGAAPPQEEGLLALLWKRHYSEDAFRQCGLFFIRDEGHLSLSHVRPRFRGRLMIPIRDHQGRVVAFTARQTDFTPQEDPAREAKYVNSPETPIFSKSNLLFNLDRARSAVKDGAPFVLVEGQLDAIRCWSVGLKTAVAPQGTAITANQLQLLRRYHQLVECFFDSDSAGQKAALRFLPLALKAGLEVKFLKLRGAEKLDPDLLFRERGLAAYQEVRAQALSAMAFACQSLLPEPSQASIEQKARIAQDLYETIAEAESAVVRSGFLQETAQHLDLPLRALERDFETHQKKKARTQPPEPSPEAKASLPVQTNRSSQDSPEQHLLLLSLHFETLGRQLSRSLPPPWIDRSQVAGALLNRFLGEMAHGDWPGRDHLDPLLETHEERTLVASLLFEPPPLEDPQKIALEGLRMLRQRALEPRLRKIELDLARLKADSNADALSLIKERTELQRQLRQPIGLSLAV